VTESPCCYEVLVLVSGFVELFVQAGIVPMSQDIDRVLLNCLEIRSEGASSTKKTRTLLIKMAVHRGGSRDLAHDFRCVRPLLAWESVVTTPLSRAGRSYAFLASE